ncbi:MAG: DUF1549 and DUF1553 domain-containing protein [Verrucomicrobiales bacterium]|nr:DUF1549 and DUF1553 domain-containing protein [Verrucomicrobiales bacterium]
MNPISGEYSLEEHNGFARKVALVALSVLPFAWPAAVHSETGPESPAFFQSVSVGAPDPREILAKSVAGAALEEGRKHWAFQPIAPPKLPTVRNPNWPRGAIDRFVLAQLEANHLHPVVDAKRHTWLRRVTFDLTGLPPTAEEISSFVNDASPQAHERAVDRLLASVAFGERWARHWLDLVGYADQLGTVNDVPAPHAWRYRDYVIRALNADKPFDQFMREQIAGDLLPADTTEARQDALTATGFLLLGEIHIVTSDKRQLRADIVDHQIQKVGTTFLGQTLGCVRCHDHKFDPIYLDDYYGLAGIFGSSESAYVTDRGVWSSILTAELPETPAQRADRERALREHAETVAKVKAERAELTKELAEVNRQLTNAAKNVGATELRAAAHASDSGRTPGETAAVKDTQPADPKIRKAELDKKIASLDTGLLHLAYIEPKAAYAYAVRDSSKPADGHVTIRGNVHAPGDTVPRGFIRVVSRAPWPQIPPGASGRAQLADWLVSADNPLPARVTVNRIWQKLFGEGLVRSVDYFGTRGDPPTHPELLDWLAHEFIQNGWSQKKLIREIVLSRVYGLSSAHAAAAAARDPDNRLLWRMNRRRLDAESLRDAVLAASGELLSCAGGPALALHLLENVGGLDPKDPNPVSFKTSKFPEEQHRQRTIYLPVVRSRAQPGSAELRNLFDFVPPTEMTGQRPSTSVATQALFLMNSEFIKSHAGKLADWVLKQEATSDRERLEKLYVRALNRPVTEAEVEEAERFLGVEADGEKQRTAWAGYCHAMLSSNEFLFCL